MAKRKIISIDGTRCNGCGRCIPNCPEGAIRMIDGKARLVSDLFCDGLGACLGYCPQGAIHIEEREAVPYDERRVMENIVPQGENVIRAHLEHLHSHHETGYLQEAMEYLREKRVGVAFGQKGPDAMKQHGCPGSRSIDLGGENAASQAQPSAEVHSELRNWPVQLALAPVEASYFNGAHLLIAADCVAFSYAGFHRNLLKGRVLLVGCPKLDDVAGYQEKLTRVLKANDIASVTCAHMEVPCCYGLVRAVASAVAACGKDIPLRDVTIGIRGEVCDDKQMSGAG